MQSVKTGARLREILNLRWEWVDLERALLLPDSKTNTKCIIPQCANYGRARCLARVGTYVIPGGSPRPRTDLNRPWRAVSKRAVLDGVRIHDLRHTHANIGAGTGLGLPVPNCSGIRRLQPLLAMPISTQTYSVPPLKSLVAASPPLWEKLSS